MEELHFTGNCLKGSRPILSFDAAFDKEPHLQVIRELFQHIFGVPPNARKSKPFVDHVLGFTVADGKIWIRNYQINEVEAAGTNDIDDAETRDAKKKEKDAQRQKGGAKDTDIGLVEIGPRFVLTPMTIQSGSFSGQILYSNKAFVSPNQIRADLRRNKATRQGSRAEQIVERRSKKSNLGLRSKDLKNLPRDEMDTRQLFA
jgi:ribosome biogenesis protein BRX1